MQDTPKRSDEPAPVDEGSALGEASTPGARSRSEYERIFHEHNQALLNFAYARVRSWVDAKDVVQEAYVKVFDLGRERPVGHLRAYLYKTVRNCAADWIRQRSIHERFASQEYFRLDKESASAEHIWLLRDEIRQALDALPPRCRLAMILVNLRGLNYQEAAKCMQIKPHSEAR